MDTYCVTKTSTSPAPPSLNSPQGIATTSMVLNPLPSGLVQQPLTHSYTAPSVPSCSPYFSPYYLACIHLIYHLRWLSHLTRLVLLTTQLWRCPLLFCFLLWYFLWFFLLLPMFLLSLLSFLIIVIWTPLVTMIYRLIPSLTCLRRFTLIQLIAWGLSHPLIRLLWIVDLYSGLC